ncbi:hypothetical protein [Photobacterium piscicola]|uniref:hypothetical protein n=1 Tax=Photobacterium piscicola TaxID=1378299 RepID=UPI0037358A3D
MNTVLPPAAQLARNRLSSMGLCVQGVTIINSKPIVRIKKPVRHNVNGATAITERVNGQLIKACIASFEGFYVKWYDDENHY